MFNVQAHLYSSLEPNFQLYYHTRIYFSLQNGHENQDKGKIISFPSP